MYLEITYLQMIIFKMKKPQKDMPPALEFGKPRGSLVRISETGYINKDLFTEWLIHFQKFVHCSPEHPVLLLLDGHTIHSKNLQAIQFCRQHGIHMLQLPSHYTHRLQPLDVAFFEPLQLYSSSAERGWLADKENVGKTISMYQIASLFRESYNQAATLATVENAFRGSGIWPIDREHFPEHLYAAADAMNAQSEAARDSNDEITSVSIEEVAVAAVGAPSSEEAPP